MPYARPATNVARRLQPNVRSRYMTPVAAANSRVPVHSRSAIQVGTPMCEKNQYQGPIGSR